MLERTPSAPFLFFPLRAFCALAILLGVADGCSRTPAEPRPPDAGAATARARPGPSSSTSSHATAPEIPLGPLAPDAPWEGTLLLQVSVPSDSRGPAQISLTVTPKKARWNLVTRDDETAFDGYRVYDAEEHRFYTVMPSQKLVMTTDESALVADAPPARAWKLSPMATEPKGAVHGVPCQRMQTEDDNGSYVFCAAKGLVPLRLDLLGDPIAGVVPYDRALVAQGLFPLGATARERPTGDHRAGRVTGVLIVLSMNRGRVPDSAFAIPPLPRIPTRQLQFPRRAR